MLAKIGKEWQQQNIVKIVISIFSKFKICITKGTSKKNSKAKKQYA